MPANDPTSQKNSGRKPAAAKTPTAPLSAQRERFDLIRRYLADKKLLFAAPNDIGRLSERSMHKAMKLYLEPDEAFHEVRCGRSVADIRRGDTIWEIQTGALAPLVKKLTAFIATPDVARVNLVCPLVAIKHSVWIDPGTGEMSRPTRSRKTARPAEILDRLYYILPFIGDDKFRLHVYMLEAEECKQLNGYGRDRKHRAQRTDIVPLGVVEHLELAQRDDYRVFIPEKLRGGEFTMGEWSAALRQQFGVLARGRRLWSGLDFMRRLGLVCQCGKRGHEMLWRVIEAT